MEILNFMSRFATPYNFTSIEEDEKKVDDTVIVETAGYQPRERLINSLISAGLRLQETHINEFDGEDVEKALENADITRSGDFDIVDAFGMLDKLSEQEKSRGSQNGTNSGDSMSLNEKGLDSLESEPTN